MRNLVQYLFLLALVLPNIIISQSASFTTNVNSGCLPLVINFTNISTNAISYEWDFGNGAQSTLENPSTVFTQPGLYNIQLIAIGTSGSDTLLQTNLIEVLPSPTADFQLTQTGPYCEDDNLFSFQNLSTNAISYLWDFGDGNTSTDVNPTYTYTTSGSHVINLIATNNQGCTSNKILPAINIEPNPIITAYSDVQNWCDPSHSFIFTSASSNTTVTSWSWNFGDGNTTSTSLPTTNHQYNSSGTYNVSISGISTMGCSDTITLTNIEIFSPPNSTISISNNTICLDDSIHLDIISSSTIQSVVWDFDNGNISAGNENISYLYPNSGTYLVSADITDSNGCISSVQLGHILEVLPSPTALFSVANALGCAPLTVQFNSSTNVNNNIMWNFGDDSTYTTQSSPSHTYMSNGVYYPQLIVTDPIGCSSTYQVDTVNTGSFNADFSTNIQTGCAPLSIDFTSLGLGATNWYWDFGDGNTSSAANPTHVYNTIGVYDVSLITWNSNGCVDTTVINSYIDAYGEMIQLPPADTIFACSPYEYQPNAQNIGISNWSWNFGDGNTGTGPSPTNTYTNSGVYTVNLSVTSPNGCTFFANNFAHLVIDGMTIDLDINSVSCDSSIISITNNSVGIANETWVIGNDTIALMPNIYNVGSNDPSLLQYQATSIIGCQITNYLPLFFDCYNNDTSSIVISPPLDTMPIDPNNPGPIVTYPDIDVTCGPEWATLISPFTGALTYFWDFGDGNTSSLQNPSHYYNQTGVFHLTHYAISSNGDTSTLIIEYFITQHVINPNFNYSEVYSCNNSNINFISTTINAISWNWDLGSGSTGTGSSISHSYPLSNSMENVTLTVSDTNGCINSITKPIYLFEPVVNVDQETFACFGDTVQLSAYSNMLYTYQWNMGDGTTYSTQFIDHVYQNPGFYNVTLEVIDAQNCSRFIDVDSIEIFQPVSTFTPNTPQNICVGESISYVADNLAADSFQWSFGNTPSSSPNVTYNSTGIFDVSLQVSELGCVGQTLYPQLIEVNEAIANFSYTQNNACLPITVAYQDLSANATSWSWDFGDGNTSSNQNPQHTFNSLPTNDVILSITDANGCTGDTTIQNIQTLNANLSASDTIVCTNAIINFNSISIMASSWKWNFGDGSISNLENPSHQYTSPGLYDISLIISDGQGCTDTIRKEDFIEVQQVIADFTYTSPTACPPIISQFNNLSTGATNYLWDFGDSSSSILSSPSHIYTAAGTYNISLIATNDIGCSDTIISNNPILVPGPILDFNINNLLGCDSMDIQIQNNSSNAISYYWDFGDGSNSYDPNPSHTYSNPGTYLVTLIAEDTMGCESFLTYYQPIEILNSPIADFSINQTDVCVPASINMTNLSTYGNSYQWSLGQQTSTLQNTSFNVFATGQQEIVLIAFNQICTDTTIATVTGHFQPPVTINHPGILCSNEGVVQLQTNFNSLNPNLTWSGTGINNNGQLDPTAVTGTTTIYASLSGICSSDDSITVTIQNAPNASIITTDLQICEGENLSQLQAANPGGLWLGPQTHPFTGNISSSTIPAGNYTITYQINGTCPNSDSIELTVLPQPVVQISDPGVICSNQLITSLNSNLSGGSWSGNNIDDQTGKLDIATIGAGTFNYYYTIDGDCPAIDSIELVIHQFSDAQIIQPNDICLGGDPIDLQSVNSSGLWSGAGINNPLNGLFHPAGLSAGAYTITFETYGLCNDVDSVNINIHSLPKIDFQVDPTSQCIGSTLQIINNSPNIDNETYMWFIDDSLFSTSKNPTTQLELGGYYFSVQVTNQFGCKAKGVIEDNIVVYDTTPLPAPEIIRSTVINDMDVYTEWLPKQTAVNVIKEYVLFKSADQLTYEYLGTLDPEFNHFTDVEVDVYNENYTYYVVSINQCNVASMASNISSSVLLGYEKPNEFQTILRWTSYENWKKGVNRYEIQQLNEFGQWEKIKIVNHDVNQIIIDP